MEYKETLVSPTEARTWLLSNQGNRSLNQKRVALYAKEMREGRWKGGTYEFLKFSKDGKILDGQHRLHAIVKAGVSVKMMVAYGLDDSVFTVLDTGKVRNGADTFKVAGIKNSAITSAIISSYMKLKNGVFTTKNIQYNASNELILNEYNKYQPLWSFVTDRTLSWYRAFSRILTTSQIGSCFAVCYEKDQDLAVLFFNQLATGRDIQYNVINILRQKLTQDRLSTRRMLVTHKVALIIKAWNAVRAGKDIKNLVFRADTEDFPLPL